MSKKYTHLSLEQRNKVPAFLKAAIKQKIIPQKIGVHPSTISKELNLNIAKSGRTSGSFVAENAQRKTDQHHRYKDD